MGDGLDLCLNLPTFGNNNENMAKRTLNVFLFVTVIDRKLEIIMLLSYMRAQQKKMPKYLHILKSLKFSN